MTPDVLLILCDTARADAFRPWGGSLPTPTIERLCREGISYTRATSQSPWTLPSTASILSGQLPTQHGISGDCFRWDDGRPTSPGEAVRSFAGSWLPDVLGERGYRTWAASCNIWISPWGGFDRGFDEFLHLHDRKRLPRGKLGNLIRKGRRMYGKEDRGGRRAIEEFHARMAGVGPEPLFALVNLMEVHAPYDPPRPFYPYPPWKRATTRFLSGGSTKARRFLSYNTRLVRPPAEYVQTIRSLYFNGARYEDWLLGRLLDAVEDRGRPTVVAVVSDHGEHLGEHGLFNHNSSLGQTLLHVPLVVWGSKVDVGQGRVDEPVSLLGLADWLRCFADGNATPIRGDGPVISEYESTVRHNGIPAEIQGLLDSGDPSRVPGLVYHPGIAVRHDRLKYIWIESGEEHLYDVEADPAEEHDLLASKRGVPEEFASLVEGWRKRRARSPTYDVGEAAEGEIAEHLRGLGYID